MKTLTSFFFMLLLLAACTATKKEEAKTIDTVAKQPVATARKNSPDWVTICIWNELGVRDTPGKKGKYVASIYLGEHLQLAGDTASETVSGKKISYHKIQLTGGKEGWVQDEFIAIDALPAVFINTTNLCQRPDLASSTDKSFPELSFVAVRPGKDKWVEVTGKRIGDKWFSTGFVNQDNLTFKETDIAFAVLYQRAMETTDEAKRKTRLAQLAENKETQSSVFYGLVFPSGEEQESEP